MKRGSNFDRNYSRLKHINKALNILHAHMQHKTLQDFLVDHLLQDAVLFQLVIIGEAIQHVHPELLKRHNYPWYKIHALRNFIVHEYFHIRLGQVWELALTQTPVMHSLVQEMILEVQPQS